MEKYINRNALYKELIRQGGNWSYPKICNALDGKSGTITVSEKLQLLKLLKTEVAKVEDKIRTSTI